MNPSRTPITPMPSSNGEPNPYLDARRTWGDAQAQARAGERLWQILTLAVSMIALAAVGGIIYIGSLSKRVPYVVVTDHLGTIVAQGVAERAPQADKRATRAWVLQFVQWLRTVTPDAALQWQFVHGASSMVNAKDPAYAQLNQWYQATKDSLPKVRAEKVIVSCEGLIAQQVTPESWLIDWTEREQDRDGRTTRITPMRSTVTVYSAPVDNASQEVQQFNPFGVFVKSFSCTPKP